MLLVGLRLYGDIGDVHPTLPRWYRGKADKEPTPRMVDRKGFLRQMPTDAKICARKVQGFLTRVKVKWEVKSSNCKDAKG